MSSEVIRREIGDWNRFANRRQVASYTGLRPIEHSSEASRRLGPVTKHGNPRLRHCLIEAAWRLIAYRYAIYAQDVNLCCQDFWSRS